MGDCCANEYQKEGYDDDSNSVNIVGSQGFVK